MKFETLYKRSSAGRDLQWSIKTRGSSIITESGIVGGSLKMAVDVCYGKNKGKANATTPQEQAIFEAKSRYQKKLDEGYLPKGAQKEESNLIFPMLAKVYEDHKDKVEFPCFVQPKLDGLRAIFINGKFYSRKKKHFPAMDALGQEILKHIGPGPFDGELYNHELRHDFEEIVGAIKRHKSEHPLLKKIQYHVYDFPIEHIPFVSRLGAFQDFKKDHPKFVVVRTDVAKNHEDIKLLTSTFKAAGYEGAMVRNSASSYQQDKRTHDLLKVKSFDSMEFQIVGIEEGKGSLRGAIGSFKCQASNGKTFKCKLAGDNVTERLKDMFHDEETWKGKWLEVQFQGFTKQGVPRFPVGLRIREDMDL